MSMILHGHTRRDKHSSTYNCWSNMKSRCNNPNNPQYFAYGGRGITVCKRWNDFFYFLKDMGERPANKYLDRIDNDGNYEPCNCRWATPRESALNRRPRKL